MKKRYIPRISDVLGLALILAMLLLFLASWLSAFLDMSVSAIFLKIGMDLSVFLLPILLIVVTYKRFSWRIPRLSSSLDYNESAMLTVSSFGAIVLIQVLYASVFPSVIQRVGVAETDSIFEFMMLFFASVVVPAVLEELFFRGVVLRTLTVYRGLLAILISSVVYALMAFSLTAFPLAFFCGFLIGSVYYATGSLTVAVGIHFSANAVWFLAETVSVYVPEQYSVFMKGLVISCVLLFAFGLPFLKKTVRAILSDEREDSLLPSSQFWSVPITIFLISAICVQIFFGTV